MSEVSPRRPSESPAAAPGGALAQEPLLLPPLGHGAGRGGGRRSSYATRSLTEGSVPRSLFFLAWPQIVAGMLQTIDQLADLVWAGFIGSRAIASIGVAQSWTQLVMTGRMGLDTATRAMIARAVGSGDIALANHIALQSFFLSGSLSLLLAVLGFIFTEALLRVLGVSEGVIAEGAFYMRLQFMATFTISLLFSSSAVLQASGDTLTPMKAQMANRVIHLALSPFLVFGIFVFPEMGLAGAALANAIAQGVGMLINFYVLFTGQSRLHLTLKAFRIDFRLLWRMVRIGAPASTTNMERAIANLIVVMLVTPFGDLALAAYSITQRVQMFVNMGSNGMGQSSGIMVGQNLGAQHPDRARQAMWWALGYCLAINAIIAGIVALFPVTFLSIFTRDAGLMEVAVPWLHIQVIGFVIMGSSFVFMQSFNTAGDTFVPMVVTFASMWIIEIPAALMLTGIGDHYSIFGWQFPTLINLGQFGIAWAIVLAMAARIAVYFPYFLWGPWDKKKVL